MKMVAAAIGVALFAWTVASVGLATLGAQIDQLGLLVPLMLALAGVRFAMQAAGWRFAMPVEARPGLVRAVRAVIAGEAAGYLALGPLSREPVKALMVKDGTPENVALSAAILERIAYMGAAAGLVAFSLMLMAIRANRAEWIVTGVAAVVLIAGLWMVVKRRLPRIGSVTGGSTSPGARAWVVSLGILQEIINVIETYAVLAWLGAEPTLQSAAALEGLNRLANAPAQLIPGKLGVLELAGTTFAGILHLGSANGLTLVLARRARSLAWTGVGILLLTTSATRARAARRNPALV